jgi:hypothetical protein
VYGYLEKKYICKLTRHGECLTLKQLRLQCDGHPSTEKDSHEKQRRHGAKCSQTTYETSVSNGTKQSPLQLTNNSAEHLLPHVPSCTGATNTKTTVKAKSNLRGAYWLIFHLLNGAVKQDKVHEIQYHSITKYWATFSIWHASAHCNPVKICRTARKHNPNNYRTRPGLISFNIPSTFRQKAPARTQHIKLTVLAATVLRLRL